MPSKKAKSKERKQIRKRTVKKNTRKFWDAGNILCCDLVTVTNTRIYFCYNTQLYTKMHEFYYCM